MFNRNYNSINSAFCLFLITNVVLQQTRVSAKPVSSGAPPTSEPGPSQQFVHLGEDNLFPEELRIWKRLTSPTLEEKYKPHKVYANLMDLIDEHEGKAFIYNDLTYDDVQVLADFKAANSETCTPEALHEKKANLSDELFQDKPNIMNYLKHHMHRQEVVCWKTFDIELLSEIREVPKKRRQVVQKLRQTFDGLHPKTALLDEVDVHLPEFTMAIATFMSTYGRDFLEGHEWAATQDDELMFTEIFMKLLYKPCRDVSEATSRFIEYYDQLTREPAKISTIGRDVISNNARKWIASGRMCAALLEIDTTSQPSSSDIFRAYLSIGLSPQAATPSTSSQSTNARKSSINNKNDNKMHHQHDDDDDDDEEEDDVNDDEGNNQSKFDEDDDDDEEDDEIDNNSSQGSSKTPSDSVNNDDNNDIPATPTQHGDDEDGDNDEEIDSEESHHDEPEDDDEDEEEDEEEHDHEEGDNEDEDTDLDGAKTASKDVDDDDDDEDDLDLFEDDDDDDDASGSSKRKPKTLSSSMMKPMEPRVFQSDIFKKINEAKKKASGGS